MQILLDNALLGIDDQNYHMSIFDRLQRFHNGKFFNGFLGFTPPANAGGIDQRVGFAPPFEVNINAVSCRARLVINHHPFLSEHSVDEGRFADIWPTSYGNLDAAGCDLINFLPRIMFSQHLKQQLLDTLTLRRGNGEKLLNPEACKFSSSLIWIKTVNLVYHQIEGFRAFTQIFQYL